MLSGGVGLRVSLALALISLLMVAIAENGRVPIDNPSTHLELTMVHEAMVLEYSGRHLALIEAASMLKLVLYMALIACIFLPWGIAEPGQGPLDLAIGLVTFVLKLACGAVLLALFETGAILWYLAEKTGRFMPADTRGRYEVLQWLMFQMGGVGPMFGQLGFFHAFKGREIEDKRPRDRYVAESRRLLGVLDRQLEGRDWITGDYSIADIATAPWVNNLVNRYKAGDLVGADDFANVAAWVDRFLARPAVQRGLVVGAEN